MKVFIPLILQQIINNEFLKQVNNDSILRYPVIVMINAMKHLQNKLIMVITYISSKVSFPQFLFKLIRQKKCSLSLNNHKA